MFPIKRTFLLLVAACATAACVDDPELTSTTESAAVIRLPPRLCDPNLEPYGLIGDEWRRIGGRTSALGCPLTPEMPHPSGRGGRVQTFTNGQIAWSPQTWPTSVQVGYVRDRTLYYYATDTSPFSYDKFIVTWDRDGVRLGQRDLAGGRGFGFSQPIGDSYGRYVLAVEGCDNGTWGSTCRQGWTLPVTVDYQYRPVNTCAGRPVPYGLIGDQWRRMRSGDGPLGCPIDDEHDHREGPGRVQTFERGSIGWSPNTGPSSVQALWLQGQDLVFAWGPTAPFTFDVFHVRLDRDGAHLSQDDVGSGQIGTWSRRLERGGTYRVAAQGCDRSIVGSDDCRAWSNPLYVTFDPPSTGYVPPRPAQPPRALLMSDPGCPGVPQPQGLYRREWMRLGGPLGPMGCPTSGVMPLEDGQPGGRMQFQNGQIAQNTRIWPRGVVAAYSDGWSAIVDWSSDFDDEPLNYNYDSFLVRWDRDGVFDDQDEIVADMFNGQVATTSYVEDTHLRTHGKHGVAMRDTRSLRVVVEGCDVPDVGESDCDGWLPALTVTRTERDPSNAAQRALDRANLRLNLTGLATPTTLAEVRAQREELVARAVFEAACRPALPWTMYRNEGDYGMLIAAKLAFAEYWQGDTCPGRDVSNRAEAFASLARQHVESRTGTTIDIPGLFRTGEYDVALAGLIPIVYRYWNVLPLPVREHVVNELLNARGPSVIDDFAVLDYRLPSGTLPGIWGDASAATPFLTETENHTLQVVTSRYLTNQILYARSGDAQYDNARNGVGRALLIMMNHLLRHDFVEYNARPYQDYALGAILNLANYASPDGQSGQVKTAARMVLDYVSAKLAASTSDARRLAPFRRKVSEFNDDGGTGRWLYEGNFDPATPLAVLMGGRPRELGDRESGQYSYFIVRMGLGDYGAPDQAVEWMRPGRRSLQRFHHYADELYASSPSFLLSAGGHYASPAYTVLGIYRGDDIGLAVPTSLMPTDRFRTVDELIRFEGASEHSERSNMCVTHGFACGLRPEVPTGYVPTSNASCFARAARSGSLLGDPGERSHVGLRATDDYPWTFLDVRGECNPGGNGNDYYVAVFRMGDIGFLEAFDVAVHPEVRFDAFVAAVLQRNSASSFHRDGENTYRASDGRVIDFVFQHDSRVVRVDGQSAEPDAQASAAGDVITGDAGVLRLRSRTGGRDLVLDGSDRFAPRRYETGPIGVGGP